MSQLAQSLVSDFHSEKLHDAVAKWYEAADKLLVHNEGEPFEISPDIYQEFSMLTAEFVAANNFDIPIKCLTEMTAYGMFMFSVGRILHGLCGDPNV